MWNCNGLTRDKLADGEFCSILTRHDIVGLLESWTEEYDNIDIEGYQTFIFYRKFQHRNSKRNNIYGARNS